MILEIENYFLEWKIGDSTEHSKYWRCRLYSKTKWKTE